MLHVPGDSDATEDETTGYRGHVPAVSPPDSFRRHFINDLVTGTEVPVPHNGVPRGPSADLVYDEVPAYVARRATGNGGITPRVRELLTADFGTPDEDVYADFGPGVDRKSVRKAINRVRKELAS
jgi:hypothetical protein